MAYMTNREFAEHEYNRQKQNAYADALVKEVRRLREENARLKADLEIVQRREKAAVGDLYRISPCDACKHYDADNNTCARPDVHYDECFEWRGPQEAGEGERDG